MFKHGLIAAVAGLAMLAPAPAFAPLVKDTEGLGFLQLRVVALDGDTLLITEVLDGKLADHVTLKVKPGETRVRLWGIDAPEMRDRAGWFARGALDDMLAPLDGVVACRVIDTHKNRLVGRCDAHNFDVAHVDFSTRDLGARMLFGGWAVTYRTFTHGPAGDPWVAEQYDLAEATARRNLLGFWRQRPLH